MRKLKLGELGRLSPEEYARTEKLPLVLVLDNIRSALNIGSIFRTADAFAIRELVLCGITARPPHREMLKTALGATETVAWRYFENTTEALEQLRSESHLIVAIEQTTESIPLHHFNPTPGRPCACVLGNEVKGVSEQAIPLCDLGIEIPQFGTKHSLNVAVCAGIVCWEFLRKYKGWT